LQTPLAINLPDLKSRIKEDVSKCHPTLWIKCEWNQYKWDMCGFVGGKYRDAIILSKKLELFKYKVVH
jgi:hypothetical protein